VVKPLVKRFFDRRRGQHIKFELTFFIHVGTSDPAMLAALCFVLATGSIIRTSLSMILDIELACANL
jgi:hypothetical protein